MRTPLHRWRLAGIALGLVALLAIGATSWRTPDQAPVAPLKAVLATPTQPYSGLVLIALRQGYFAEAGLQLENLPMASGKAALDMVLAGKADLAVVAETPLAFAAVQGAPIAVLATVFTGSGDDPAIIGRRDAGIARPEDLPGKRIGVTLGTNGEFVLDVILNAHGVAREKVTAIDVKPDGMLDALASGRVDAVSTWHPIRSAIQGSLAERIVSFEPGPLYTWTFNLASTRDFAMRNPETVRRILTALLKAEEFMRRDPRMALNLLAAEVGIESEILGDRWAGFDFRVTLGQALIISMEDQVRWLVRRGSDPARSIPNLLEAMYPDALQRVRPERVAIIR